MKLIKNSEIYGPELKGINDILISNRKILAINPNLNEKDFNFDEDLQVIDASNLIAIPGFIDHHIHFNGAGGEGGPKYRTSPLEINDLIRAGITSAIGLLGTDGVTRSVRDLLMKARSLEDKGITTWIYTGSYQIPSPTITDTVINDITMIDKIIGVKIAVSDHRSSHVSINELRQLISEARTGGILAGNAGIVNIHMGDEEAGLSPLLKAIKDTNIPLSQLAPTHMNRSEKLYKKSIKYGKKGGYIDLTTGDLSDESSIDPSKMAKELIEEKVPIKQIKMSTDAGGSLPVFDENGELQDIKIASPSTLKKQFDKMVLDREMSIENSVKITSTNIADQLKLNNKGRIEVGKDADILLLDKETLELNHVIAKGKIMLKNGRTEINGKF